MFGNAAQEGRYGSEGDPGGSRSSGDERTLFEILGVPEDAKEADIEFAFKRFQVEARMDEGRLPPGVRLAYKTLRGEQGRRFYLDLLAHCRSGLPITPPRDKQAGFVEFCEAVQIRWWRDPAMPGSFVVRRPGQPEPGFVAEARRREQDARRLSAREREQEQDRQIRRFFPVRTFLLRFGYIFIFAFAAIALFSQFLSSGFDGVLDRVLRVAGIREDHAAKQLEKDCREALALATDSTSQLDAAFNSLRDTVHRDLSVSLESPEDLPAELRGVIEKESTVSDAWKAVQKAYAAKAEFQKRQPSFTAASNRVRDRSFLEADLEMLRELRKWSDAALQAATSQQPHIQHIRAMLDAERFQRAGEQPGKEP